MDVHKLSGSVDFLHFPDDSALKHGQDGGILTHFLINNTAVELVARFLKEKPTHTHTHITLIMSAVSLKDIILCF